MLTQAQLPAQREDETLALRKLRWMQAQPGLVQLRAAIRITETDGGNTVVEPAPRLLSTLADKIASPAWLQGTWQAIVPADGRRQKYTQRFTFTADDIAESQDSDGSEPRRRSLRALNRSGKAVFFEIIENEPRRRFSYAADVFGVGSINDSFSLSDGGTLLWSRDEGPQDIPLQPVAGERRTQ